jgi:hypothetical protein
VSDSDTPRPFSLRRRLGLSFLGIGAVLLVLVAAVAISTAQFVLSGNRVVYRWQPALSTTHRLLTDLVDQVASVRGYALSHNPGLAADYRGYRSDQERDAVALRSKVAGDGQLTELLDAFGASAAHWQATVADAVVRDIRAGDPRGTTLVQDDVTHRLFQPVDDRANELLAAVNQRTRVAIADRRNAGTVFVVAVILMSFVLAAIGIAIWRGLHRWVLAPVDRLGEQTREVAGGDTYRQIVPVGPNELRGLGRDVEAMRLQIAGQLARAEEIQEELRVRGAELARSNDDLQQFAYVASHDLSEPLRKVANFCQLLERQYSEQLDDRARQYIDFAVDGAKRMQALITDLLALSRVGRTTDEFAPVAMGGVTAAAQATMADRISEAGGRVEVATALPVVAGDRSLLVSLMENLIGNAIKYRRPDVAPVVRIAAALDSAEHMWTVRVQDNGIGIEPQYAERIFAVFQRLHVRDAYEGTGIGLALCRRIVEFHGGRIWLEPVESTGQSSDSPFRKVALLPNRVTDVPRGPLGVLLVEDDPGDVVIAKEALKASRLKSNLTVVPDGVEALKYLRREEGYADADRPDLILLDLNLPRKSGHEVLAEVKSDPSLRQIPIVVLTTSGATEDVERSYDLHANAFVTKPVDFDHFTEVVKQIDDFFITVASLPPK